MACLAFKHIVGVLIRFIYYSITYVSTGFCSQVAANVKSMLSQWKVYISVVLNWCYGLVRLMGSGQQYLVDHCVVNKKGQSLWYRLVPNPTTDTYGKKDRWWDTAVWTCCGNCSQAHTGTLTSFCSTVAFTADSSLLRSSRLWPGEPFWDSFLCLMLPSSISCVHSETNAHTRFYASWHDAETTQGLSNLTVPVFIIGHDRDNCHLYGFQQNVSPFY